MNNPEQGFNPNEDAKNKLKSYEEQLGHVIAEHQDIQDGQYSFTKDLRFDENENVFIVETHLAENQGEGDDEYLMVINKTKKETKFEADKFEAAKSSFEEANPDIYKDYIENPSRW